MSALQTYIEVHVVSDLHLGGEGEARQIFNQGEAFAGLVAQLLKTKRADQALVINGDLVDFLAEPDARYFDPTRAADKLDRIIKDKSFVPVWDALREFVKAKGRQLVITLGNHDLELALPWVRDHLLAELSRGSGEARERMTLAFRKWGYGCRVGSADIRCAHGNEVDSWNVTDYQALRRFDLGAAGDWTPNAGTKLVIDVMNDVKREYPFVDLLKPENEGVIPTLLVLKPSLVSKVGEVIPVAFRRGWDRLKMGLGLLGGEAGDLGEVGLGLPAATSESARALGQMLGAAFGPDVVQQLALFDLDTLLQDAEKRLREGTDPLDLARAVGEPEFLGFWRAIQNLLLRKGKNEVLREALERLREDKSFDLRTADDTYRDLGAQVPEDADFLTAGHTHLERALPLDGAGRFYFNSGTWTRLIQMTDTVLATEDAFQPVYSALSRGTMTALDGLPDLVVHRRTVISFWADDEGAHGELRRFADDKLQPVPGTHFVRG
jgi:UDP-2,3-diacylglucosamine pyrophosphatase LpxH